MDQRTKIDNQLKDIQQRIDKIDVSAEEMDVKFVFKKKIDTK